MGLEATSFGGNSRRGRSGSANDPNPILQHEVGSVEGSGGLASPSSPGIALRAGEAQASLGSSVPGGQVPWRPLLQIFAELSWAAVNTLRSWEQLGKRSRFPGG